MRNIFYNTGYFLKETLTVIRLNRLSNFFSLLSTGLIFFILSMIISSWWISSYVMEVIRGEAEINIYVNESIGNKAADQIIDKIRGMEGVREVRLVDEEETYGRMEEILGKEAKVMEFFDDNPFTSFIEVKIDLDRMDYIMSKLDFMPGIEYIRDNREVLERLRSISQVFTLLGYLVVAAVGISTVVIISHIIRMGIYQNKEQINTLKLLGAPGFFIGFPFLLVGLLLTAGGGLLAGALSSFVLQYVYTKITGPLPFIPLPPLKELSASLIFLIMSLSTALGVVGSILGLASAKST